MTEKSKEESLDRLLIKETTSISEVNKYIRNGWQLLHVTVQFGRHLFMLVKE